MIWYCVLLYLLVLSCWFIPLRSDSSGLAKVNVINPDEDFSQSSHNAAGEQSDDLTIVGTVDGNIHAVNSKTGKIWTTTLPGGSLTRSFQSPKLGDAFGKKVNNLATQEQEEREARGDSDRSVEDDGMETDGRSEDNSQSDTSEESSSNTRDYSVIPTLDGSILVHSNDGMRKTSVKARMLSDKDPYVSQDGLIFTGQKTSRLFGVDLRDGKIFHDTGNPDGVVRSPLVDLPSQKHRRATRRMIGSSSLSSSSEREKSKQLWIGRVDYTLRAFNEMTGTEEFNLTYSELHPMSKDKSGSLYDETTGTSADGTSNDGTSRKGRNGNRLPTISHPNAKSQRTPLPLLSTPEGELYFTDDKGNMLYSVSLDSPAVSAFKVKDGKSIATSSVGSDGKTGGKGRVRPDRASMDIQLLKIAHRLPSGNTEQSMRDMLDAMHSSHRDSDGSSDSLEGYDDNNMVVVRSLNDGGIYALEIPDDISISTAIVPSTPSSPTTNAANAESVDDGEEDITLTSLFPSSLGRFEHVGRSDSSYIQKPMLSSQRKTLLQQLQHHQHLQSTPPGSGTPGSGVLAITSSSGDDNSDGNDSNNIHSLKMGNSLLGAHKLLADAPLYSTPSSLSSTGIGKGTDGAAGEGGYNEYNEDVLRLLEGVTEQEDGTLVDEEGNIITEQKRKELFSSLAVAEFDRFLASVKAAESIENGNGSSSNQGVMQMLYEWSVVLYTYNSFLFLLLALTVSVVVLVVAALIVLILHGLRVPIPTPVLDTIYLAQVMILKVTSSSNSNSSSNRQMLLDSGLISSNDTLLLAQGTGTGTGTGDMDREGTPSPLMGINSNSNESTSVRVEVDDHGRKVSVIGSIRIYDTVLGYGSQGTVVLQGSLNGRPVAVKRMLSQMNRSANREIALLIRSDGHPNVVRYFLRETQGEFVYLALQLCKMSLRDFIMRVQHAAGTDQRAGASKGSNKLSSSSSNDDESGNTSVNSSLSGTTTTNNTAAGSTSLHGNTGNNHTSTTTTPVFQAITHIDIETKQALLQISEGLAHLHSQRIVHRDIKPHNILCALSDADIEAEIFDKEKEMGEKKESEKSKDEGTETGDNGGTNDAATTTTSSSNSGSKDEGKDSITSLKQLGRFTLKISDMGLSKQLDAGDTSFASMSMAVSYSHTSTQGGGAKGVLKDPVGTIGWQAPELMVLRHQWSHLSSGGNGRPGSPDRGSPDRGDGKTSPLMPVNGDSDESSAVVGGHNDNHSDRDNESHSGSDGYKERKERNSSDQSNSPSQSSNDMQDDHTYTVEGAGRGESTRQDAMGESKSSTSGAVGAITATATATVVASKDGKGGPATSSKEGGKGVDEEALTLATDRKTQTVDIFSLGCVFHYVLVPGEHPFGNWYERESNIMAQRAVNGLWHFEEVPDCLDLLLRMLNHEQEYRPSSHQILHHPFFWNDQKRLDFFTDLSDYIETDSTDPGVIGAMEIDCPLVIGSGWGDALDQGLLDELGRYRKYDFRCIKDLLRVMRNKRHHFNELSAEMKALMGTLPGGFVSYFESKFPYLLIHCVKVVSRHVQPHESLYRDYVKEIEPLFGRGAYEPVVHSPAKMSLLYSYVHHLQMSQLAGMGAGMPRMGTATAPPPGTAGTGLVSYGAPAMMGAPTGMHPIHPYGDQGWNQAQPSVAMQMGAGPAYGGMTGNDGTNPGMHGLPSLYLLDYNGIHGSGMNGGGGGISTSLMNSHGQVESHRRYYDNTASWIHSSNITRAAHPAHLARSAGDMRYRSRLCTHWENSGGGACPMKKKGKCDFAHGPLELRIKETRRDRWLNNLHSMRSGTYAYDEQNSHPQLGLRLSGGEDVLGAARSIERVRHAEGSVSEFERISMKVPSKGRR